MALGRTGAADRARAATRRAWLLADECGASLPGAPLPGAPLSSTPLSSAPLPGTPLPGAVRTSAAPALPGKPPPGVEAEPPRRAKRPADVGERLSEAEQRVAELAATGRRNHDIARELSITASTVEQHLTRAYRKLGVTGRADLPAALDPLT
ncbi:MULTISPECIES: helix-turn-helix transcriptional regulator [Actinosynnema]|uniref:helix-turn-helix domain-containing protein n=1 Tax=Actinosynnema TaxID=40566 RepID=UPI0020A48A49|nr:helix-turn-helix transcriptional regulator [Actinosynnema pretiosum]